MPEVSICIPTYNTAKYLPFAIDSVLAQSMTGYELVICDDGSTDNTPEICGGYDDPRIRYIRLPGKSGQAGNFNRCLNEARGEFVTILHADDYFLPGFLEDRVGRLTDNPELGFVFGAVEIVDGVGAEISTGKPWPKDRAFGRGELLEPLLQGCILSPPSLMVRKAAAEKAGPFRTDLTWGHDWEWALRLAEHHPSHYVSKPLSAYRVHDESGTAEQLNAAKNGSQERRIILQTIARLASSDKRMAELSGPAFKALSRRHMYFAEQALLDGRSRVSRNNLWYAALADPTMLARPTFWALLSASAGPVKLYTRYRALRDAVTTAGNR
ncbi:MAG TPA: glycosyltransferase [Blastocatellia bacterium]